MNFVGNLYNFTVQYDREPSGKWGNMEFSFDGMPAEDYGLIENLMFTENGYDCAVSQWLMKAKRTEFVDFSWPFPPSKYFIVYNTRQLGSTGDQFYVKL